jgi:hypothetical protein
MAKHSQPYEDNIKRHVRDFVALDPLITIGNLTKKVSERLNHNFDPRYIAKMRLKVEKQSLVQVDMMQVEDRLKFTRENYRMVRERLMKIIYWEADPENPLARPPANKDVIEAAKNIVMMDLALFQAEMANGLYKKPIEEIAKNIHYEPLPGELRTVIISSWTRGGFLPKSTIEKMVPLLEHATTDGGAA